MTWPRRGDGSPDYDAEELEPVYRLAYDASLHLLAGQESTLGSIRTRASAFAGPGLALATFLIGIAARADDNQIHAALFWGLLAAGLALLLEVAWRWWKIQEPRAFVFELKPDAIVDGYWYRPITFVLRTIAQFNAAHAASNKAGLDELNGHLRALAAAMAGALSFLACLVALVG